MRRRKGGSASLELRLACPYDSTHRRFAAERRLRARQDVVVDGRGRCVDAFGLFDVRTSVDAFATPATCEECGAPCVLSAVRNVR